MASDDNFAPSPRTLWRKRTSRGITVRVMGVVEGYVVFRRKGAAPWLLTLRDWHINYEPQSTDAVRALRAERGR